MMKFRLLLFSFMLAAILTGASSCTSAGDKRGFSPSISDWMETAEFGEHFGIIYSQQEVGLWTTGEGKVTAVPDMALLRLGIEAEAKTVAKAQRDAAEAMDRVMKALKSNGVSEKDTQTQQFSIYPVRRWLDDEKREEVIGYRVTNMLVAKIREIEKAGTIIDAVAEAGGDLARIENISFTVDDPTPYYKEAREKAIEDAMAKAKQIADVAGIELGKLIYVSEGSVYMPPVRDIYMKGESIAPSPSPTPISPGELEFQLIVNMVYEID